MTDFIECYVRSIEGLINAYRILLAIEKGEKEVELYDTERDMKQKCQSQQKKFLKRN